MKWQSISLGDLIRIKHGFAFKSDFFSLEEGNEIVLTPGNFHEGGGFKLRPQKDRFYTADYPKDFLLNKGDVIIAMTEQAFGLLGSPAIIPDDNKFLHNQRLGKIEIIDNQRLDLLFLYYLFCTRDLLLQISNTASGVKVRHTAPERIYRCNVSLSALSSQKKIAAILSAHDNLIENNLRRIELLEQSAQELYKEWFVRFKFPGHENLQIIDGVPEGWVEKTAFDVLNIMSGGTPKTKIEKYWNGDIPFFTPKDANGSAFIEKTLKNLSEDGLKNCNSRLYEKYTVFITARGSVGKINMNIVPMAMNQSCYALSAKLNLSQFFLYIALINNVGEFKQRAGGAVFDAIIVDTFKFIPFMLPNSEILENFDEVISPIFHQIESLFKQNRLLKHARDLLIPRLMKGEIEV